ncbi:MAG: hypothetical protein J3K34DRAFT_393552, partial [Monoraphidium minutum]
MRPIVAICCVCLALAAQAAATAAGVVDSGLAAGAAGHAAAAQPGRALLAKCAVPNCKKCTAGDTAKCEVCKPKTYLSISQGTCECMPGHYFKGKGCRKCPRGTVSPGGSATTGCVSCAGGRVANPEQSECIDAAGWGHWGGDLSNRRWNQVEKKFAVKNAGKLRVKWEANVVGSTSATPTVAGGKVFVPDWE